MTSLEYKRRKADLERIRKDKDPRINLLGNARERARQKNLPFEITREDIIIPEVCPILKVPIVRKTYYAPSIDRIDNALGYTKNNIQIISHKANAMKNSASKEELNSFAQWILNN